MRREKERRKEYRRRKEETGMKQIIVLIAMVLLGITLAGFVSQFGDSAKIISDRANSRIETVISGD